MSARLAAKFFPGVEPFYIPMPAGGSGPRSERRGPERLLFRLLSVINNYSKNRVDTAVGCAVVRVARLSLSADLSRQFFSLRQYSGDTVYHRVNNFVFATEEEIGTGSIDVEQEREVAGIGVVLRPKDYVPFAAAIDTMSALMGSIAESLDLYTVEPRDSTKTVLIPLRFAPDRMSAYNSVEVFPSGDAP